jgi:hypothetical protein
VSAADFGVAIEHRPVALDADDRDLDEILVHVTDDDAGDIDVVATLDELEDVVGRLCAGVMAMVVALDDARQRAGRESGR